MVMSGYSLQEPPYEHAHYHHAPKRFIEWDAAEALRSKLEEDPNGTAAAFLITAAQEGWMIQPRTPGELVPGYDHMVVGIAHDIASEEPAKRAYGTLLSNWLGVYIAPPLLL